MKTTYKITATLGLLLLPFHVFAAPADHGRSFHSSSVSVGIGQIILLAIVCVLAYLGIKYLIQQKPKSNSEKTTNTGANIPSASRPMSKICPHCNGKLFIDIGELSYSRKELNGIDPGEIDIYWGQGSEGPVECARRICPFCKGRGTL